MYCVYILRSLKDHKHYIGYTANLEKRLREHNRGKSISVRQRGPFELLYTEDLRTKIEAIRREKQIKAYKGGEAFKKLISSAKTLSSSLV